MPVACAIEGSCDTCYVATKAVVVRHIGSSRAHLLLPAIAPEDTAAGRSYRERVSEGTGIIEGGHEGRGGDADEGRGTRSGDVSAQNQMGRRGGAERRRKGSPSQREVRLTPVTACKRERHLHSSPLPPSSSLILPSPPESASQARASWPSASCCLPIRVVYDAKRAPLSS